MKSRTFIILFALLLGLAGYLGYKTFFPDYIEVRCKACDGTGKASCGAPDCVHGRVPCSNPECLNINRGEWVHMHVDGHPDTDLWHRFDLPNGGWESYSQGHQGHVIKLINGHWTDTGPCPVCLGTKWMECPVCHGQKQCPTCQGKGTVRQEI